MSISLITGNIKFDHLAKVVSTRFLHCKFFPFVMTKYLIMRYFESI